MGRMHISRIGLTVRKGARHTELPSVRLDRTGPVGDRVFCLVDPQQGRVLRTVAHPRLVLVEASWDGTVLRTTTPEGGEVAAEPRPTGEEVVFDYWGREARLAIQDSPHARQLGEYLGTPVLLGRITAPGMVVYGGSVSLASTGEIAGLGESDSARFRATFTIDSEELPDHGTELAVGEAVVRVRSTLPRCRVIDIDTRTARMDTRHLATLADRPHKAGELPFGRDADVVVPGTVRAGDPVRLRSQND